DATIFETAQRRAPQILTARAATELSPEGWIAGGRECERCAFSRALRRHPRHRPHSDRRTEPGIRRRDCQARAPCEVPRRRGRARVRRPSRSAARPQGSPERQQRAAHRQRRRAAHLVGGEGPPLLRHEGDSRGRPLPPESTSPSSRRPGCRLIVSISGSPIGDLISTAKEELEMGKENKRDVAMRAETALATANYFEKYGQAASGRSFVGDLLKFGKDGIYVAGKEAREIARGASCAACARIGSRSIRRLPPLSRVPPERAPLSRAAQSQEPQPGPQPGPRKAGKRKYGAAALIIADGVIRTVRRDGGDLLLTEGELHFYRDGLWSPA